MFMFLRNDQLPPRHFIKSEKRITSINLFLPLRHQYCEYQLCSKVLRLDRIRSHSFYIAVELVIIIVVLRCGRQGSGKLMHVVFQSHGSGPSWTVINSNV